MTKRMRAKQEAFELNWGPEDDVSEDVKEHYYILTRGMEAIMFDLQKNSVD